MTDRDMKPDNVVSLAHKRAVKTAETICPAGLVAPTHTEGMVFAVGLEGPAIDRVGLHSPSESSPGWAFTPEQARAVAAQLVAYASHVEALASTPSTGGEAGGDEETGKP